MYPVGGQRGAQASAKFRVAGGTGLVDRNHPEHCPQCGKKVYFTEEIKVRRRKWHKLCFKCGKRLGYGKLN